MKRKIGIVIGVIVILLGGLYFSKNYIIKKFLESKLTEVNKGKVDIKRVRFFPLSKKIVIENIDITSRKDGKKNFASIGKFEADYDIYFKEKKFLVSRANFSGIEFMTQRSSDGSLGYQLEEKNNVVVDKSGIEEKKDSQVQDLEELIRARAKVNKTTLQNTLKLQYEDIEEKVREKREYWNNKIEKLETTPEYMILKQNYEKISQEKNPLKIIRMENEIKNMVTAFKTLSKEFLKNRNAMEEDFKTIINVNEMNKKLETTVNELVGRGEFVINDLDSIINYYLNEIYGDEIKDIVVKYRNVMREIELRKDEDVKLQDIWEVFIEEVTVSSKVYGIELKGEVKNISSRLSKNKTNIEIYLTADSDTSHGEIYGYVDLNKIQGKINTKISNFNFKDLKEMEILHRYVEAGEASLEKEIVLSRDNIDIIGNVEIQDMSLNSDEITGKLNIASPLLKAMIKPLLKDLKSGNIGYSYNSLDGKLVIKSDLSQEIMNILNDKDGSVKKKIIKDMIKEGKEEIEDYNNTLNNGNQNSLKELEGKLNEKLKYLDKVQEALDKFNIGGVLRNI
ncbi:Uncharacterised protein [Fusobacterium necrogenes]|uniref:TIGR03545 family protein n=1 Tax=Fusobacterium necrogenes TaxID=858 RepID=A0A377GYV2_9FUSO|nr:hypothetical protein [Fusobacterium necrogenes]STO31721.1 Uncharacterised protein [Fusobacterium necrogenes]